MLFDLVAATVVHEDFEVHLGFAAQLVDAAEELPLVRADGLTQDFIVIEDGAETEGKNRGVLKAVRDDPGVVNAGLLIQGFLGIVLTHNDSQIAGGIEEDLVSADAKDGFQWYRFAMPG
jgi:hypothetical protein